MASSIICISEFSQPSASIGCYSVLAKWFSLQHPYHFSSQPIKNVNGNF